MSDHYEPPTDPRLLALANRALHDQVQARTAERDRLRRVLAVELDDDAHAPDGWHLFESGWWVRQGASVERGAAGDTDAPR